MSTANKEIGPPVIELGAMGWLRKNLFSNWYNSLLTILGLYLLYILIPPLANWIFLDANFVGSTRDDCTTMEHAGYLYNKISSLYFMDYTQLKNYGE